MANLIIPMIVFLIIVYAFYKKVEIYNQFLEGVKEGLTILFKIFPTMFAMTIAIDVFLESNILNDIAYFFTPLLSKFSLPKEFLPLALIRPISGSSSLVVVMNIFKKYGPDSFIGRIASILQGSTDTTIYIISLYFSSVGIKKIRYALIVGLIADFSAIILSILFASLFF